MKKIIFVLGVFMLMVLVFVEYSSARLLLESSVPANKVQLQPYTEDAATLVMNCTEGGSTVPGATESDDLHACTCYSTTSSSKIGAIKIKINNVDRWIRTYDGPQ